MWINLDEKEIEIVKHALSSAIGDGPAIEGGAAIVKKIEDSHDGRLADIHDVYRNAVDTDDELEVDDDAIVSMGADPGAWVHAWVWVPNSKAGIEDPRDEDSEDDDHETCRTCGEKYDPYGDGYDGECPSCADKTDQKLHPENYE